MRLAKGGVRDKIFAFQVFDQRVSRIVAVRGPLERIAAVLPRVVPDDGDVVASVRQRPAEKLGKYPASTERVYKPAGCGKAT